jgi:hypothetical protein
MSKKKTPSSNDGLKSMYVELENFKNIDKKIVDIGGRSILIMGKNGTGKSSIIQAMKSPMDSKILPSEPIKIGEERARISHKIAGTINGEYKEYIMDMYFTPGNKSGRLVITNEKGENVSSPSKMIKTIIGNISFNITAWMNDKKAVKLDTLKKLTGCAQEIDVLNYDIKTLKEGRKYKKERAEELEGSLKNHGFTPQEIDTFSEPIPMEALNEEMAQLSANQTQWDSINNQIQGFYEAIPVAQSIIQRATDEQERIRLEMERLNNLYAKQEAAIAQEELNIKRLQDNCLKGEEWKKMNPRPLIIDITDRIKIATEHNNNSTRIGELALQQQEMVKLKLDVEKCNKDIEVIEIKRNSLISKSQLPVEGLSFDEEEIYFKGVPLEEGQQNSALLFDIGVEVAMAMNPNLKIIFLDDASLFDKEHLKSVVDKIESRGYMAVCEIVSEDDNVEVLFTEEEL